MTRTTVALIAMWASVLLGGASLLGQDHRSAYGVCAHITRPDEAKRAEKSLEMMKEGGIGWVRCDFDWDRIETAPGKWDFRHTDQIVRMANQAGVKVLGILVYDTRWATPVHKYPQSFAEYAQRCARRYKGKVAAWEVYNEPNLAKYWHDEPDPAKYAKVLLAAHKAIRAVDRDVPIVSGGISGVDLSYLEGMYKAGAREGFDVLAVHPYRWQRSPEDPDLHADLTKVRRLMNRFGDDRKPLWITEIGWRRDGVCLSSGKRLGLWGATVRAGLKQLDADRKQWTLAVLSDPDYPGGFDRPIADLADLAPGKATLQEITVDELPDLDPDKHHALIWPTGECMPEGAHKPLRKYVQAGGFVVFSGGVPLYYTWQKGPDGLWVKRRNDDGPRKALQLSFEASWQDEVPERVQAVTAELDFADRVKPPVGPAALRALGGRYLVPAELNGKDRMIRILTARQGRWRGTVAGVLDFDGELAGGLVVWMPSMDAPPVPQELAIPRATLLSLHAGVQKVFWYEFSDGAADGFGLLKPDMEETPAFRALRFLTRIRPAQSKRVDAPLVRQGVYMPSWTRADGQRVWALWAPEGTQDRPVRRVLTWEGAKLELYDHVGGAMVAPPDKRFLVELTGQPIYVFGPEEIRLDEAKQPDEETARSIR